VPPARIERGLDAHDAGENPVGLYDAGRPVGLFFSQRACRKNGGAVMLTTRVRVLSMAAVLATACGSSSPPTAPTAPAHESSVALERGQTISVPGTDLTITLVDTYVFGRAAIECVANAPCNYFPRATLYVAAPGVGPETRSAYVPNPISGPEAFPYAGYVVRATGLEPAWSEAAALNGQTYKVLLTITAQ
jgi:hypothetical protein